MAKYSRTEKYKDLRDSLQNDVGSSDLDTDDLVSFQNRLNRIDPQNFEAPRNIGLARNNEANHVHRVEPVVEEDNSKFEKTAEMDFSFTNTSYQNESSNGLDAEPNDYLDRYINEVKQYNISRGNATSEDTQVNILNRIHPSSTHTPFPEERRTPKYEDTVELPTYKNEDTASQLFGDDEDDEIAYNIPRNISEQVKSLVDEVEANSKPVEKDVELPPMAKSTKVEEAPAPVLDTSEFDKHFEMEKTARQQLLNETSQMRAQLDDYEDDLSEVNSKMNRTNKILNIVLIVLIVALVIVLGIIIYMLFFAGGN